MLWTVKDETCRMIGTFEYDEKNEFGQGYFRLGNSSEVSGSECNAHHDSVIGHCHITTYASI